MRRHDPPRAGAAVNGAGEIGKANISGNLHNIADRRIPSKSHLGPADDTSRFIASVAPDQITLQTFNDAPVRRSGLAKIRHGPIEQHVDELRALQARRAGVFLMINRGDGRGRSEENVVSVRALFLDLDGAPPEPVFACGAPPHVVVESSPGRFHFYWLVADCPLDRFGVLQKALAAKFNGDPVVFDLCRVMRLPGFLHQKEAPFLTRLLLARDDIPVYRTAELVTALQLRQFLEPAKAAHAHDLSDAHPRPRPLKLSEATPVYFRAALERAALAIATAPNGRQNHTLNREAFGLGQFVAAGSIPESTARRVLTDAAGRMVDHDPFHPWSAEQIARMIDRAFAEAACAPRRP